MHGVMDKHQRKLYEWGERMENDYKRLVGLFKDIVLSVMAASVQSDIVIGEVVSAAPLVIELESKMKIPESNIVLTKNTCEWSVDMTVDHHTENAAGGGGYAEYASHSHGYKGRKTYLVHNQLAVGDKVILIQESGGQRYIALDKWYNPNRGCSD